jgi:hypothetical protein
MNQIEHEGKTYILKDDMESIIKDRLAKMAARASEAEAREKELAGKLDELSKVQSTVDILTAKYEEAQANLSEANRRYERHTAISKHGITDPEIISLLEWQYSKDSTDSDITLDKWLDKLVTSPEKAPITLRPHLMSLKPEAEASAQAPEASVSSPEVREPVPAPRVNTGTEPAPVISADQYDRALGDPDLYRQLHEQIKSDFYKKAKR